jgi:hypothetical protein
VVQFRGKQILAMAPTSVLPGNIETGLGEFRLIEARQNRFILVAVQQGDTPASRVGHLPHDIDLLFKGGGVKFCRVQTEDLTRCTQTVRFFRILSGTSVVYYFLSSVSSFVCLNRQSKYCI